MENVCFSIYSMAYFITAFLWTNTLFQKHVIIDAQAFIYDHTKRLSVHTNTHTHTHTHTHTIHRYLIILLPMDFKWHSRTYTFVWEEHYKTCHGCQNDFFMIILLPVRQVQRIYRWKGKGKEGEGWIVRWRYS